MTPTGTPNALSEGIAYRAMPSRVAFVPRRASQASAASTSGAPGRVVPFFLLDAWRVVFFLAGMRYNPK